MDVIGINHANEMAWGDDCAHAGTVQSLPLEGVFPPGIGVIPNEHLGRHHIVNPTAGQDLWHCRTHPEHIGLPTGASATSKLIDENLLPMQHVTHK